MADRINQGGSVAERQRGQQPTGVGEQQRRQESGGVLGAVTDAAQGAASGLASAAEQAWETTSRGAQQAASAVSHTAEDVWSSTRACMGRYPFATFFVGVGVGAMVMMALQRR